MPLLNRLSAVTRALKNIKLVDRCLIVIMAILMAQSAYSLFVNEAASGETNTIDIVMRTTSAAIFGYFLSVNFLKCPAEKAGGQGKANADGTAAGIGCSVTGCAGCGGAEVKMEGAIGFAQPDAAANVSAERPETGRTRGGGNSSCAAETSHQQVIIATIIGAFSLVMLIIVRNYCNITPAMFATVSQLRDFVSGCVGFLVGSPDSGNES